MKNLFKNLMLVAVAAMAFTACTETNDEVNAVAKKTVFKFTADFGADTRSYFGEKDGDSYPSFWEGGERVTFVAPAADYNGTYSAYAEAVKLDDEGTRATFTVEFDNAIKAGTVYAYVGDGWNVLSNYAYVNNNQTPRENSVDPSCHMAYTSFEYDGSNMEVTGTFKHGVAYGKMTINGFDGKKISKVAFQLFDNEDEYPTTYTLNTAELDTHTYWFAAEACQAKKFVVSVVVDDVTYSKEVALTEAKPLNFNVGRVSTFSVSNLVKEPVQLDSPIITTSFVDGKVTATWEAIANAVAYDIEVNGEVVEENFKATTYIFDAEYNTQYEIAVTAKAAEGSADYADSYKANTYITTPLDINMEVDYEVTLTSYTVSGSTYRFEGDTNDWISIPFHTGLDGELPAGTYTGVYGSWSFSATTALEYDYFNTSFNLAEKPASSLYWNESNGLVVVERGENDTLSLTAIVTTSMDGYSKSVKYIYTEVYTEPVELDGKITKWTYTDTSWPTKYKVEGEGFSFYVGMKNNRRDYIDIRSGGYSLGDSSTFMRYFSIHDISIPSLGDDLSVTAGTLKVNEGGTSGAIHDIDITLTIDGAEYEFSYYGYINGEAVENGGGSEPEPEPEPELPANITLTTWNEGTYDPANYRSNYIVSGDNVSMKVWMTTDHGANATSLGETHDYNWIERSYVGNSSRFSTQDIVINGVGYSASSGSTMNVVNKGDGTFNVTMNLSFTDGTATTVTYTGAIGATSTEPENPSEGGGETPDTENPVEGGENYENWAFKAAISGGNKYVTFTGDDDKVIEIYVPSGLGLSTFTYNSSNANLSFTDVKVNGALTTNVTSESSIKFSMNPGFMFDIDLTIDGVHYTGTSMSVTMS